MEGYGNENPGAFQPTRPLRGATEIAHKLTDTIKFQPTRPLRGATPCFHRGIAQSKFQPTRPLRGATHYGTWYMQIIKFQPTRPLRGATVSMLSMATPKRISTHAPLAGRDYILGLPRGLSWISTHAPLAGRDLHRHEQLPKGDNFNPRAPCGARQQKCTNHYAHFCDNRQISDAFAQNAACQGILLLFDAGKPCGFWVRTAQVISARLCFAL